MLSELKQSTKDTLLVLSCTDKKVPQRSSRPTFRSLINCNAQPKTSELAVSPSFRTCLTAFAKIYDFVQNVRFPAESHYRSNNTRFVVVSLTLIIRFINGRTYLVSLVAHCQNELIVLTS